MAKKINGYARDNYGVIEFVELGKPEEGAWDEATLVVGKERVFTETEVRAMLNEMIDYARDNGYLAPAQPTLSVDKIMEVYHEHERWFNLHGGAPAKRSGNFKARINKLLKTNERE